MLQETEMWSSGQYFITLHEFFINACPKSVKIINIGENNMTQKHEWEK